MCFLHTALVQEKVIGHSSQNILSEKFYDFSLADAETEAQKGLKNNAQGH